MEQSKFELLRSKEIISILDGDYEIEKKDNVRIAMPYLTGPDLCNLSTDFGLPQIYYWDGKPNQSRWKYLDNLLEYAIKENKINQLLAYMFSKEHFMHILNNLKSVDDIKNVHKYIVEKVIECINSKLYFGGNKLVKDGKNFSLVSINNNVNIETPNLKIIDSEYIKSISERAIKDINNGNFDSAITKARTILEETFCYVIEMKKEEPSASGDIGKLYKQVKDLYNMHTDSNMDKRINKLLSGLENIVHAMAEMRNNGGDSHGLGTKRINIESHHTILAVNLATIMSEFILSIAKIQNNSK